jgi:hypothetical protein
LPKKISEKSSAAKLETSINSRPPTLSMTAIDQKANDDICNIVSVTREQMDGVVEARTFVDSVKLKKSWRECLASWLINEEILTKQKLISEENQKTYVRYRVKINNKTPGHARLYSSNIVSQMKVDSFDFFSDEASSLINKDHPYVASFMGICLRSDKSVMLIREYLSHENLEHILFSETEGGVKKYKLSFWRKMNIAQSIASAMNYVLQNKFSNPNLKMENILFHQTWDVKLTDQDFRSIRLLADPNLHPVKDEIQLIYDYGLLLYTIITEKHFCNLPRDEKLLEEQILKDLPNGCPEKLRVLILNCMFSQQRPTFQELATSLYMMIFFLMLAPTVPIYVLNYGRIWDLQTYRGKHFFQICVKVSKSIMIILLPRQQSFSV